MPKYIELTTPQGCACHLTDAVVTTHHCQHLQPLQFCTKLHMQASC